MTPWLAPLAFAALFVALGLIWSRRRPPSSCDSCSVSCHRKEVGHDHACP
jgi:hypothetical protein